MSTSKMTSRQDSQQIPLEGMNGSREEGAADAGSNEASAPQYFFGCGPCCRPKWLQVFAKGNFYTFMLAIFVIISGAVISGFTANAISTLERRYNFSSVLAGLMVASFDITVVLCVIFVSYFGGRGHKPRWLGIGIIIEGVGCLVFASPQFIFFNTSTTASTVSNSTGLTCQLEEPVETPCEFTNTVAYIILIVGQILLAIGTIPLFTLGLSYLDEIIHPKYVSLHLGVIYVVEVVGPVIGFAGGGALLSIYIDPWIPTTLTEDSPNWRGNWWLGFIIGGILSFIVAIPFLMFPRQLSNTAEVRAAREEEMAKTGEFIPPTNAPFKDVAKTFGIQLKNILTTPPIIFNSLSLAAGAIGIEGLIAFAPKFIENQYYWPASTANILVGVTGLVTAAVGAGIGSVILFFVKKPQTKGRNAVMMVIVVGILSTPFGLGYLPHCGQSEIVGINARVNTGINSLKCSSLCNCNNTQFLPVCGADGFTYASGCSAGCDMRNDTDPNNIMYSDCSCVLESLMSNNSMNSTLMDLEDMSVAEPRVCNQQSNCALVAVLLVLVGIGILLTYSRIVPLILSVLRCVSHEERHLALGVISVLGRVLGSIPAPLITGAIFDSACLLRNTQDEACGLQGSCLIYDNQTLSIRSMAVFISGAIASTFFAFLAWLTYPKNKKGDANTDNTKTEVQDVAKPEGDKVNMEKE